MMDSQRWIVYRGARVTFLSSVNVAAVEITVRAVVCRMEQCE